MPHSPHPPVGLPAATWGNCARNPGLLHILLALIATLLGRTQTHAHLHAAWYPCEAEDEYDEYEDWNAAAYIVLTHNHADCDPRILYVIGPPPNRGMRALPREIPTPRPKSARAPPPRKTSFATRRPPRHTRPSGHFSVPSGPPTRVYIVPISKQYRASGLSKSILVNVMRSRGVDTALPNVLLIAIAPPPGSNVIGYREPRTS